MKIAHVTDFYLPRLGGIEVHVHDLAERQRAAGHTVEILTSSPPAAVPGATGTAGAAEPDEAGVRRLSTGLRWQHALHPAAPRRVRAAIIDGGYDVVHAHAGVWSPLAFAGAWSAAARDIPTVVTEHSMLSWATPLYRGGDRVIHWSRQRVQWSAVSEVAAAPLRAMLPPGRTIEVLPNAVDVSEWEVDRLPRDDTDVLVVAVMRLAPRKRAGALLRMLRLLLERTDGVARVRAVVVGDGPERPSLERYLRRHQLAEAVSLVGRRSRAEIRETYRRADIFVAPARLESFGIAALEARSAGVPVVGMRRSGLGDFVRDGTDGLLVDSDTEMVRALARLATRPELRAEMAARSAAAPPSFGWNHALAATEDAYRRAADLLGSPLALAAGVPALSVH